MGSASSRGEATLLLVEHVIPRRGTSRGISAAEHEIPRFARDDTTE
jgi:hypothetical protein